MSLDPGSPEREVEPASLADPVRTRLIVDILTERIEQAMLTGELELGSEINEKQMAERLRVSRSPLREALRRLEARRLIERIPNVGSRIVSIGTDDVREIYLLREVLEGAACRLAVDVFDDAERDALLSLAEHGQRGVEQSMKSYSFVNDLDFHQRIIVGTRNKRLTDLLMGDLHFLLRILRSRASKLVARPKQALDEHAAIARAIVSRDGDAAEHLMRAHIRAARDELIAALEAGASDRA
ncbi:MAG: GntR family transcriptional regulator [Lautropia sp.]